MRVKTGMDQDTSTASIQFDARQNSADADTTQLQSMCFNLNPRSNFFWFASLFRSYAVLKEGALARPLNTNLVHCYDESIVNFVVDLGLNLQKHLITLLKPHVLDSFAVQSSGYISESKQIEDRRHQFLLFLIENRNSVYSSWGPRFASSRFKKSTNFSTWTKLSQIEAFKFFPLQLDANRFK